jgi:ferrochelatase
LLVNLGTPDKPTEVAIRRYLKEFLSDPRVISSPRFIWWFVLRLFILPRRPKELEAAYRVIWREDSPIRSICKKLVSQLQDRLSTGDDETCVQFAMTYGGPSIQETLEGLNVESLEQLLVIPLYPQYSTTTTEPVLAKIHAVLHRTQKQPELQFINNYHEHPLYIEAVADSILDNWKVNGRSSRLLLSFHGLPLSHKDPYAQQCERSAALIATKLRLQSDEWMLTYQSRRGNQPWLQPYTDETLRQLAAEGVESVTIACPGFAVDCLETLHEIEIEAREIFLTAGGTDFQYVPALNASSDQTDLLLSLISKHIE